MTETSKSDNRSDHTDVIKFLYSYGGRIIPRRSDGNLRYVGGHTRILAVDRSISFTELMIKFGELCGAAMSLRCKLPSEELDLLITVKSDEEFRNVMEEYARFSLSTQQETKIRAILYPIKSPKIISQPSSPLSCFDFPAAPPRPKPPLPYTAANRSFSAAVARPVRIDAAELNGVRHDYRRVYFNNLQGHIRQ